jgi:hypothetical protein
MISRLATEGDASRICRLYEQVFQESMGRQNSLDYFDWFYYQNPAGEPYSHIIEDNGEISAFWGVIPQRVWLLNEEVKACVTVHLMSNSKVLATPYLAKKVLQVLARDGVKLTFGFMNENSSMFLKRLNWEMIKIPFLLRVVQPGVLLRYLSNSKRWLKPFAPLLNRFSYSVDYLSKFLRSKPYTNSSIYIEEINYFDEEFNQFWNTVKPCIGISVIRDAKYLNWRYVNKPKNDYRIVTAKLKGNLQGYIVTKVEQRFGMRHGVILDILTIPDDSSTAFTLLNYAIKTMIAEGVEVISALSLKNEYYFKSLRQCGFIPIPPKFFPQEDYFGSRPVILDTKIDNKIDPKDWYFTWGDHDDM